MTDEERKELERKAFEEEQRKEALREKEPSWKMYSVMNSRLNNDFSSQEYISNLIKDAFDNDCTGDETDRWAFLQENFAMKQ